MIMITRKQIEEILDDTLEGDNPPDSAPTVVGKEECVNRLMELVKNCSIPVVSQQRELLAFRKWQKDNWKDVYLYSDDFMISEFFIKMKIDLEQALNHPLWMEHERNKSLYQMDGKRDKWEIVYYPIFQDGKTQEYYDEPRALMQNIDKGGFWSKEVPLRYLVKIN